MSTSLSALIDASFAPTADLGALESAMDACFAALLADETPPDFPALTALAERFRERARALPTDVQSDHARWLHARSGWYKLVLDDHGQVRPPPMPAGTPSAPLALYPRMFSQICELRYALHRRDHPAPCDCAALRASGQTRAPASPALRCLGPETDGYYFGDAFVCDACGARWFRGVSDDDVGSRFWQPLDAP